MYTSIIISDTADSESYYSRLVDFSALGFQKPYFAESFSKLTETLEKKNIDLAVLEEGFCGIDFTKLFEKLNAANPYIEIITISTSDSPIREKRALSLGVLSYLHRPLASQTFSMVVLNAKSRLDRSFRLASKAHIERKGFELEERFRSYLMSALFFAPSSVPDIEAICKGEGLRLDGEFLRLGYFVLACEEEERQKIVRYVISVLKKSFLLEEYIGERFFSIIFSGEKESLEVDLPSVLREISSAIKKNFFVTLDYSLSSIYSDLADSSVALFFARDCLSEEAEERNSRSAFSEKDIENAKECSNRILALKKQPSFSEFDRELGALISKNDLKLSSSALALSFLNLTSFQLESMKDYNAAAISEFLSNTSELLLGKRYRKELSKLLYARTEKINSKESKTPNIIAKEALDYITRNFADSELSVKFVADLFNISQNYLSSLMKKELGETFVNILSRTRMEKAKELLLATNKKVSQIAFDVGFSDSHYFSFSFKKYYGISPLEMRGGA